MHEKAKAVALNASGIPIGTVFALVVTPIIVTELGVGVGVLSFGLVGVVWYIAWHWVVHGQTPRASADQCAELGILLQRASCRCDSSPTMGEFLRNKALWAIIVAHFATIGRCM